MDLVTLWRKGLTRLGVSGNGHEAASPGGERNERRRIGRNGQVRRIVRGIPQWFTDRMDVRRLKRMVLMLDRVHGTRDWFEEPRVRNRIRAILRQEVHEPWRDFDPDRSEEAWRLDDLRRDCIEWRDSRNHRRVIRESGHDRREIEESRRRLMREVEILNRLRQIQPAVERGPRARLEEGRLLDAFLKLAREDTRADQRDRRRQREDMSRVAMTRNGATHNGATHNGANTSNGEGARGKISTAAR